MSTNTRANSTPTLVDKVFGKVATVRLASLVLLTFLHCNLLTVELDGKKLLQDQWPEACAFAASSGDYSKNQDSPSDQAKKEYLWKWCEMLNEGTLHGLEIFLNVVGLSAYIAAIKIGAVEELHNRSVTTRFATLPHEYGPLPVLTSVRSSYARPHFFVLPSASFVSTNKRDASCRPAEFLEMVSPVSIIEENFPFILSEVPHGFQNMIGRLESSSQTEFLTASNQTRNPHVASHSTMSIGSELIAFAAALRTGSLQPCTIFQVEQVLHEQSQRCFLDLSRACAPEVLLPGVVSVDMSHERVQRVMEHQRRSQPWFRHLLGLAITGNELGLFRADAAGLEGYIFDRTTGFGVIQCIRIALGITVATNEELGIHPAFSFREAVSKPLSQSDYEGGKRTSSDVNGEMPPSKKARKVEDKFDVPSTECPEIVSKPEVYRYKEVNFCTLENRNLHPPDSNMIEAKVKYYVKYLLQDEGSLFGRSTRIWCVYKEVSDEEREKYAQENGAFKNTPLFVGPFALKMYNADIDSQAYRYDLVQKVIEANVRYVVLPKHVWYLGRIVRDLRPGHLQSPDSESDDYEEIMMISPFKRTLAQFSDVDEFYRGLIDALKGIETLADVGLMHCDISTGNILLEAETYPASKEVIEFVTVSVDGTADIEIALLFQPSGTDGGLHDFDLLQRITPRQKSDREIKESNRVGTLPFMSIDCLTGTKHTVIDDIQSLFYVLYLSMFQMAGPVPDCYPSAPKQVAYNKYPEAIQGWADEEPAIYRWPKEEVYAIARAMKTNFFEYRNEYQSYPPWYTAAATQSLPFWRNRFAVHRAFLVAFHEDLWFRAAAAEGKTIWDCNRNISLRLLIEKLEEYEETLRDLLKTFK